jgi:PAS domain S-box-containing protein
LNLLQPSSKVGYISNAIAWPMSLFVLSLAAWLQPATVRARTVSTSNVSTEKTAGFVVAAAGASAAKFVFFDACVGKPGTGAIAFATATLLVAGIRLTLTVRQAHALNTARFRSLIDNAWDLIVVTEADFEVAYITPSSTRVLGLAQRDLTGTPITAIVHPDDSERLVDRLRGLADGSTETAPLETRVRHHSGVWRTIAWTAANLLPRSLGTGLRAQRR